MTEKQFVAELSFEEYLMRNPMPTNTIDDKNYVIIGMEVIE